MPDVGHVYPDLMGASRLQTAAHMGHARIPRDDLPVGHGGPPAGYHRHLLPVRRMPSDGRIHGAAVLLQVAHHQTLVRPRQRVVAELGAEPQMGGIVFGGNDEPAGVPVDAVYDAGPQFSVDPGKAVPAVIQQGVHQCPVRVSRCGVDYQALRFVHHDDVLVLVHHVQRDVLRLQRRLPHLRHVHRHRLAAADAAALGRRLPVHGYPPLFDVPRRLRAGQSVGAGSHKGVQPRPGVLRLSLQMQRHPSAPSCRTCRRTTGSTQRPK